MTIMIRQPMWCRGVVVITIALYSIRPELKFFIGPNPAHAISEISQSLISLTGVVTENFARWLSLVNYIVHNHHHDDHRHHYQKWNNNIFKILFKYS